MKKILIMAGGTGGHVFPGLAIANALKQQNIEVVWLGSHGGMETSLVPKANIRLFTLPIKGLRGKNWRQQLAIPFLLIRAIFLAYLFLRREKPNVVLGLGGFAAGPGGIAAKILGIPLIIHDQNSIAGMTNRWLAKLANRVLCAFPNAFPANIPTVVTGNPVRQDILCIAPPSQRNEQLLEKIHLLILGGSRGAEALNKIVPETLALFADKTRIDVWHQTGDIGFQETVARYRTLGINANIVPFIDNMAECYAWTNVIICRAGALTLAEIMCVGIASILVPYPFAVDDHQTTNARYLAENHAAFVLPQSSLSAEKLYELLYKLFTDKDKRLKMANAARHCRQDNAVEKIIEHCYAVAK